MPLDLVPAIGVLTALNTLDSDEERATPATPRVFIGDFASFHPRQATLVASRKVDRTPAGTLAVRKVVAKKKRVFQQCLTEPRNL